MELHDSVNGKEAGSPAGSAEAPKKASLDRLELKRQWVQQAEEQQAEETPIRQSRPAADAEHCAAGASGTRRQ